MSSSNPSNHAKVADVLSNRGFGWSPSRIDEVQSNSSSISFFDEWNEFIKVVQRITGITSTTDMSQAINASYGNTHTSEATAVDASHAGTGSPTSEDLATVISAWNCFQQVIDPGAGEAAVAVDPASVGDPVSSNDPAPFSHHAPSGDPVPIRDPAFVNDPSTGGDLAPEDDPTNVGDLSPGNDPTNVGNLALDYNSTGLVGISSQEGGLVNVGHGSEQLFDFALFEALRESLDGYVDKALDPNWIVLKNSIIGFGRKVKRGTFGFDKNYVLSGNSECDHGCFVLGSETIEKHDALKAKTKDTSANRPRPTKQIKLPFWYNDMTATVELKLENTSCEGFTLKGNVISRPILESTHGPLGQAMIYTMDSWHCLARRGVSVESVPVVVLAGKSGKLKHKPTSEMICCVEAHIHIPQYFGMEFTYSINRIVAFNGTTGLTNNEQSSDEESRNKRAIAIYIKTMRFGLEKAHAIVSNCRKGANAAPPVSLCCRNLLNVENNAELIASPIPLEKHQQKSGIRISQGEFFQMTNPTKSMFSGLAEMIWFTDPMSGDLPLTESCLIKVSCASVHNIYVSSHECYIALAKLYTECIHNAVLKANITEVLLGYCYTGTSKTLISIIRDLRKGDKVFKMLEHREICVRSKLSKLWDGFCELVNSLLLPMADVNVVHLDIRSNKECTYNILVHENEKKIELCLIDFDSVALASSAKNIDENGNKDAICFFQLGINRNQVSAYQYLFWQVLWIAYRWHPSPETSEMGIQQSETSSDAFVSYLLEDDAFVDFKGWLGSRNTQILKTMNFENISRDDIQNALNFLKENF